MDSRLTLPYEERLCRLEFRPNSDDPIRVVNMLKDNGFNLTVNSGTKGPGYALFDSKIRPHAPGMDPDYLPRLIELCHQKDIMILSWVAFNIQDVRDTPDVYVPAKLYPEWVAKYIDEEGHKTGEEAGATGMCMFSTPYREKNADFVDEILGLGFDGIWFDGFMSYGMPGISVGCVCERCAYHFNKDTGMKLPDRINWSDSSFLRFVGWRYDELIEAGEYMLDRIKATKPDAPVHFNTHSFPNLRFDWRWSVPLRKMRFGSSQHTGLGPLNGIQQNPLVAKVAHAQNPTHADIWQPIYATREVAWIPDQPPNPITLRLQAMSSITQGVFPWYGGPDTHIDIFKDINADIMKRQPTFSGVDVKYIAVAMSDRTKDFYDNSTDNPHKETYKNNTWGIDSMLSQHHLLNNIVFDDDFENGRLEDYKVLLLSNTACLSQKNIENVTSWVSKGGTLIATHETSLYDQWGTKRGDFGLSELLGIRYLDSIEESKGFIPVPPREGRKEIAERSLELNDPSLNEGQVSASFYGAYTLFEITASDVEVIAHATPRKSKWTEPEVLKELQFGRPEVVQRSYGNGKVIYFGTDIGDAYYKWPEKNTRLILKNLVVRAAPPPLEVDAPTIVVSTARVQPENRRLVVHLLNLPASSVRANNLDQGHTIDEIIPIHDIRITLNDFDASRAKAFVQGQDLSLSHDARGKLTAVLPLLRIHEAVVFQLY